MAETSKYLLAHTIFTVLLLVFLFGGTMAIAIDLQISQYNNLPNHIQQIAFMTTIPITIIQLSAIRCIGSFLNMIKDQIGISIAYISDSLIHILFSVPILIIFMDVIGYKEISVFSGYLLYGFLMFISPSIISGFLYVSHHLDTYEDLEFNFSNNIDYYFNQLSKIIIKYANNSIIVIYNYVFDRLKDTRIAKNIQNPTEPEKINYRAMLKNPFYVLLIGTCMIFYSHYEGFGTPPPIVFSTLIAVSTTIIYEDFIHQILPSEKEVSDWFSIIIVLYISLVPAWFYPDTITGTIALLPLLSFTFLYTLAKIGSYEGYLHGFTGFLLLISIYPLRKLGIFFYYNNLIDSLRHLIFLASIEFILILGVFLLIHSLYTNINSCHEFVLIFGFSCILIGLLRGVFRLSRYSFYIFYQNPIEGTPDQAFFLFPFVNSIIVLIGGSLLLSAYIALRNIINSIIGNYHAQG